MQSEGEKATAAGAALESLKLSKAQAERVLRHFGRTQRLAALANDRESINRTRSAVDALASSSMSLELAAIAPHVADEMSEAIARSLGLDHPIPITDLLLAIEHAGRAMRAQLFVPGRPTNLPLLLVIQSLLPVIEDAAEEPVRIRRNKSNGKPAEAGNEAMKALTLLTRLTLESVTDTAVFNMTEKILAARRRSRGSGAANRKPPSD